jgi:hypothetical protein
MNKYTKPMKMHIQNIQNRITNETRKKFKPWNETNKQNQPSNPAKGKKKKLNPSIKDQTIKTH